MPLLVVCRTTKRTLVTIGVIWSLNVLVLLPIATHSTLLTVWRGGGGGGGVGGGGGGEGGDGSWGGGGGDRTFCIVRFESVFEAKAYTVTMFVAYYLLPLGVTSVYYIMMTKSLWRNVNPRFMQVTAIAPSNGRHMYRVILWTLGQHQDKQSKGMALYNR